MIRSARLGSPAEDECTVSRDEADPVELRVTGVPFTVAGEEFVLFTAVDISDANRRRSLERIFFHDILNTATECAGFRS